MSITAVGVLRAHGSLVSPGSTLSRGPVYRPRLFSSLVVEGLPTETEEARSETSPNKAEERDTLIVEGLPTEAKGTRSETSPNKAEERDTLIVEGLPTETEEARSETSPNKAEEQKGVDNERSEDTQLS